MKTADRSKSLSCASRIHHSFSFGAETPARGATTAIPCTSDIVPRLGGWRAILHISGCGGSLKTADRSKSFSCASRIHQPFIFGAGTPTRGATTAIPRTSDIVPRLGGWRAILHISGCGGSLKTADRSKSFSCASRIHQSFSFGAGTPARGATTAIPRTSDIVPRLGEEGAILHISGCGGSLRTADRSKSFSCASRLHQSALERRREELRQRSLARRT